ncbi:MULTISPECIES: TIGR03364 family FAD-dependent oxidoreductase [unclassified Roseovarius]|uniref:TIGR03364 family FAD-dependent oxidoreductase n=1 Tax=unclassified Roseovarius TaxID=2614913 RepID=UPI00273D335E|nr:MULTISPECIES: TIGR03364 family FAD-dependent oxidoreductase [unclassified Roseovarius]
MKKYDLAVIGAGIMGLAHALHAARAGLKVVVFERTSGARGASVRNFGMLALVAQAPGAQFTSASRSLKCWQDISRNTGLALHQAGCVFLARAPEELRVLEECARLEGEESRSFDLLGQADLLRRFAHLRTDNLLGGLWSPDAWKVDQRQALAKISDWLAREHGVVFHFSTEVHGVDGGTIESSAGAIGTRHTVLCGGDEFETLFPEVFHGSGVGHCTLQMLRTKPQPAGWRLDPFLLGGLSIPRYNIFASCPGLPDLKEYQAQHYATHLEHGIHLIACQEGDGSITIGDSHRYGHDRTDERSEEIDNLLLAELSEMITLPAPTIDKRWLGHYAYLPNGAPLVVPAAPDVTAVTVTNGQGMTHGFALAEDVIRDLFG